MHNETMIKHQFSKMTELLDILVGYFAEGAVPNESAYACAALAREYADWLQGHDHDDSMIDFYEKNPGFVPMMFTDDITVSRQIARLKGTREILGKPYPPPRHELMMMPTSARMGTPVKVGNKSKRSKN